MTNDNDIGRLKWTDELHEALLEKLYEHFQLGKQTDGCGFKAEAWTQAVEAVRRVYKGDGVVEESSCRNKWTWFKETWKNWKILAGTSGFGWDEEEELFKADKDVWDGLAKTYKTIRWHKNNALCFREILREILDGAQATGQGALSSNSPAMSNIDPAMPNTPVAPILQRSASVSQYSSGSQSRSSDRNESDNEDDTKRTRKKPKFDIGQAITSVADELRRSREAKRDQKSIQETAIEILYRDYVDRLDTGAFVDAVNVLESESKARIFTRLRADEKRDRWLEVAVGTEILFPPHQREEM